MTHSEFDQFLDITNGAMERARKQIINEVLEIIEDMNRQLKGMGYNESEDLKELRKRVLALRGNNDT